MAFSFGNMMRSAGHNIMQNMRGQASPIVNAAGGDITDAFGPQAAPKPPSWGQMSNEDRLQSLGKILGQGGGQPDEMGGGDALGGSQQALAAFLSRIGQGGAPAELPAPAQLGHGAMSNGDMSMVRGRRFTFGGR